MVSPGWELSRPGLSLVNPINSAKGPVSRILSCAVIPLDAASPRTFISDLPGGFGHCIEQPCGAGPAPCTSLAPDSCIPPYLVLLRVGFTLPPALPPERCALTAPFHPYPGAGVSATAVVPGQAGPTRVLRFQGGPPKRGVAEAVSFLWHWPSMGFEAHVPDVIRHTALRSSDFPPPADLACANPPAATARSSCQPLV